MGKTQNVGYKYRISSFFKSQYGIVCRQINMLFYPISGLSFLFVVSLAQSDKGLEDSDNSDVAKSRQKRCEYKISLLYGPDFLYFSNVVGPFMTCMN